MNYNLLRTFLEWHCEKGTVKKASTVFQLAKYLRMAIYDFTGSKVDEGIKADSRVVSVQIFVPIITAVSDHNSLF
ncbi:MAG TPA: hypothetical protein VIU12_02350 [Chryseolinea sp.]|jgi:hypothetical protein